MARIPKNVQPPMRTKFPTDHRQGNLILLVDAIQKLIDIQYNKNLHKIIPAPEGEPAWMEKVEYNPEVIDKMMETLKELRQFDVTEIKDLYLTSGYRVVLDKGYGEYFNSGDTKIFSIDELKTGIPYEKFMKRMEEVRQIRAGKQGEPQKKRKV